MLSIRSGVLCKSSSSSYSSLSSGCVQWDSEKKIKRHLCPNSASEEEDCTLNEMMGKFDESYVYEKETDILSDSDVTECDTDVDTGQEGEDEDETEKELDFIDNGSYFEFNLEDKTKKNTGMCSYYNFEGQKFSSRRNTRRAQNAKLLENRKNSFQRNRHKNVSKHQSINPNYPQIHYTRSAENTPLSIRKTKIAVSKLTLDDNMRKRSNSLSFTREQSCFIDQRDREANKKYKELIVEAEHILKNIKMPTASPKRKQLPTNKRVELLRSTESGKPDEVKKVTNLFKVPSSSNPLVINTPSFNNNSTFGNQTFSNQTISNQTLSNQTCSNQMCSNQTFSNQTFTNNPTFSNQAFTHQTLSNQTFSTNPSFSTNLPLNTNPPLVFSPKRLRQPVAYSSSANNSKSDQLGSVGNENVYLKKVRGSPKPIRASPNSPIMRNKYKNESLNSPKYRRKPARKIGLCRNREGVSSDTENELNSGKSKQETFGCPSSEPVKRKIYGRENGAYGGYTNYCNNGKECLLT